MTRLADKLALTSKDVGPNVIAAGMLVSLWLWAAQNATDGDLSECSDRAIAEAAEYRKKPSVFVEALNYAKLLDEDRKLHDWDEYATLLMDCDKQQREKTRQRVAKHRAKKNAQGQGECNATCNAGCNVTDTPGNAPTIPNHTLPYPTIPISSAGAAVSARAGDASEKELLSIGLRPGEFPGVTADHVAWVISTTKTLFEKYRHNTPEPWDYRCIFRYSSTPENIDLLDYAFEQAAIAGKVNDWRYIDGIMRNLNFRDLFTREQAREWDESRPDLDKE